MADAKPFLRPVVIDATHDAEAHVPEEFRAVHWTRLPAGETPAAFCARVKYLLHNTTDQALARTPSHAPHDRAAGEAAIRGRSKFHAAAIAVIGGVAIIGAFVVPHRNEPKTVEAKPASAPLPATLPQSEARQLIAKAWAQLNKPDLARPELEIADDFCKRAADLDHTDPDVWATWSQVGTWHVYHGLDGSPERRESARANAERALKLDRASFEARLAHACDLIRGESGSWHGAVPTFAPEAERSLRELLAQRPDEPRTL